MIDIFVNGYKREITDQELIDIFESTINKDIHKNRTVTISLWHVSMGFRGRGHYDCIMDIEIEHERLYLKSISNNSQLKDALYDTDDEEAREYAIHDFISMMVRECKDEIENMIEDVLSY